MAARNIVLNSFRDVSCTNTDLIKALPSPFKLGPLDHLGPPSISINAAWIYTQIGLSNPGEFVPTARLQHALALLLNYYPTLTGRLMIDSASGQRTIEQLGTGAQFLEAHSEQPIASYKDNSSGKLSIFEFPDAGDALLGPWDASPGGVQSNPLLSVKHTRFSCGSVAIGLRVSHLMCDAGGFLRLYQDLAFIYRALGWTDAQNIALHQQPSIIPYSVSLMQGSHAVPVRHDPPKDFWIKPPCLPASDIDTENSSTANLAPPRIIGRRIQISASQILRIKESATSPQSSTKISAFTALSAYLFQRTNHARIKRANFAGQSASDLPSASFLTSVGFESKMGLPPRYFPNAVTTPYFDVPPQELDVLPLWQISERIYKLVQSESVDSVKKLSEWVAAQSDMTKISHGFSFNSMSFITSAWHRFPLWTGSELDVPPLLASAVFIATALVDGLVYFLESEKSGGIDALMSLDESLWKFLDEDESFQQLQNRQ